MDQQYRCFKCLQDLVRLGDYVEICPLTCNPGAEWFVSPRRVSRRKCPKTHEKAFCLFANNSLATQRCDRGWATEKWLKLDASNKKVWVQKAKLQTDRRIVQSNLVFICIRCQACTSEFCEQYSDNIVVIQSTTSGTLVKIALQCQKCQSLICPSCAKKSFNSLCVPCRLTEYPQVLMKCIAQIMENVMNRQLFFASLVYEYINETPRMS